MARTLITVPTRAHRGEIIELRALIQHPMETGYRRASLGAMLPRDLIRRFTCLFEPSGANEKTELIFSASLHAAVAANPYLSFHARVTRSGVFVFRWQGDNGFAQTERATIVVR